MTKLLWDQVGELRYENGIDRGVLYLKDKSGVAWNGIKSVTEDYAGTDVTPLYFDGLKYADAQLIDNFGATLSALTYPDEFLPYDGLGSMGAGMFADLQNTDVFHLCYRTKISNDEDTEFGYKIHILYNLIAEPNVNTFSSTSDSVDPIDFSWKLSSVAENVVGYWPSSHVVIDTTHLQAQLVSDLEDLLYGTATSAPYLPSLQSLTTYVVNWALITVIDNEDGTATIYGPSANVSPVNSTTYVITSPDITLIDQNTFSITSTVG